MRKTITSFSAGEVSPWADERSTIDAVQRGCESLKNAELGRFGHLDKRSGTWHLGELKSGVSDWRFISFQFSSFTKFVIEVGDSYMRFWSNDQQVTSGGSPLEVVSPYTGDEIHEFQYQSIQDFIYLTHPNHAPRILKRYADDDWRMELADFSGPYEEGDEDTTLSSDAETGSVTITATEDTFEADHVGAKVRLFYQQEAFTVTASIDDVWSAVSAAALSSTDYTEGDEIYYSSGGYRYFYTCIADYSYSTDYSTNDPADYPSFFRSGAAMIGPTRLGGRWDFTTAGTWRGEFAARTSLDGVNYNTVGTFFTELLGENWTIGEDEESYIYLRIEVIRADAGHADTHNLSIGQFDVPGVATIDSFTSATEVEATVEEDFYSSGDAKSWEIEAWNEVDGYPRALGYEDNRLAFAGTKSFPLKKWYSEINGYNNFIGGTLATSPFNISAIGIDSSPVQWLSSHDGEFMGTASAEATLTAQNTNLATSAENLPVVKFFSNEGNAYIPPVFLNSKLFAIQSSKERLNEFSYSIERGFNGGYDPSEATLLAPHILESGVRSMTLRHHPEKGIWCVKEDGTMAIYTHRPKAQMAGWWRIETDGQIKGCTILRGDGTEDEIYMAVLRDGVGYIEKGALNNLKKRRAAEAATKEGDQDEVLLQMSQLCYLDCASEHTGTDMTSITGLTRFAEKEVTYLKDGVTRTGTVTAAGVLELEEAADRVIVGLPYEMEVEPRSLEAFSEFGSTASRMKHAKEVIVSSYLSVGGEVFDLSGDNPKSIRRNLLTTNNPLGGQVHNLTSDQVAVTLSGNAQRKKKIRLTHSDPYPFTLLGLYVELEQQQL